MQRREPEESASGSNNSDFVLDKSIFSSVFKKDIRRIYLIKKAERLATALQLVSPAFSNTPMLQEQLDTVSVVLIQSSIIGTNDAYEVLVEELFSLCGYLRLSKARGLLSSMNADLIVHETQLLISELVNYNEPRVFIEDSPTLAELARQTTETRRAAFPNTSNPQKLLSPFQTTRPSTESAPSKKIDKGHIKDISTLSSRQESIIEILRSKGPSYIKDISMVIRDVSEKTIQRELQALVQNGILERTGDRRWTQYSVPTGK